MESSPRTPEAPEEGSRREEDRALRAILEGTARATGTEFFRALVKQLAQVLKVRYGVVTELLADGQTLRPLAFCDGDRFLGNSAYTVKGTPCERVVYGEICHYSTGVQQAFPEDLELTKLEVDSYFGVPFFDDEQRVLGHVAVLDTRPMPGQPRARTILEIFANRAGAELISTRAQEALRQSEQRFRQLAEGIQEVFWLENAELNQMLYISPAYERIWGRSCESLYRQPDAWSRAIHPADRDRVWQNFVANAHAGKYDEEYRIVRPDGTVRWIRDRGFPVRNKAGDIISVAGIATDITKQKLDLTGKLLSAQEDERRRLARELHDDLTQRMALLGLEAGRAEQALRAANSPVAENLQSMHQQIVQLSRDIHDISRRLHPSILADLGLVEAIRSQCGAFEDRYDIPVEFVAENVPDEIPDDVAFCFYRITQEALRNVYKHAGASSVRISLQGNEDHLELTIEDRGNGFDPDGSSESHGLGLASMAERVRLVQGSFDLHSRPGRGTRIEASAPLLEPTE